MKWRAVFLLLLLVSCVVMPVAADAVNYTGLTAPDYANGTYTRYWMANTTFDGFGFAYSLALPFIGLVGMWFFVLLWFAYLARCWIRSGDVTIPIVVALITGPIIGVVFPPEAAMAGQVMFGLAIAATVVKVMIDRFW